MPNTASTFRTRQKVIKSSRPACNTKCIHTYIYVVCTYSSLVPSSWNYALLQRGGLTRTNLQSVRVKRILEQKLHTPVVSSSTIKCQSVMKSEIQIPIESVMSFSSERVHCLIDICKLHNHSNRCGLQSLGSAKQVNLIQHHGCHVYLTEPQAGLGQHNDFRDVMAYELHLPKRWWWLLARSSSQSAMSCKSGYRKTLLFCSTRRGWPSNDATMSTVHSSCALIKIRHLSIWVEFSQVLISFQIQSICETCQLLDDHTRWCHKHSAMFSVKPFQYWHTHVRTW